MIKIQVCRLISATTASDYEMLPEWYICMNVGHSIDGIDPIEHEVHKNDTLIYLSILLILRSI